MTSNPAHHSWREAIAVYRDRRVLTLLLLGFSAGLPYLLVFSTLTAWLRDYEVSRSLIGFFGWVGITYSVKVLWAPVVDRLRLPLLSRLGQRRGWILLGQLTIAAGLAVMAMLDPRESLTVLAMLAVLVAFGSATQDIAIDAYRIEIAERDMQGALAASYLLGYRIGLLLAGAGALYIAAFWSWPVAYFSMAAAMGLGVITVLVIAEPPRQIALSPDFSPSRMTRVRQILVQPFVEFFQRLGWHALVVLALIAVYRLSDISMGVMANPFYLDQGYSKEDIASITKLFGFGMTIFGSALGGVLIMRFGMLRPLLLGSVLVAVTNLLFAWLATQAPSLWSLAWVISADNLSGGIAYACFIAYLSSLTHRAYTATQYALFSSLMTLPGKFLSGFTGLVVDATGYQPFFWLTAALGIPAIALVCYLIRYETRSDNSGPPGAAPH